MYFTAKFYNYHNRRYKFYNTSLKDVIATKCLISARLDIERVLHFFFCYFDKILQLSRQHFTWKSYLCILSKYRQISKKLGHVIHLLTHPTLGTPLSMDRYLKNFFAFCNSFIVHIVLKLSFICTYILDFCNFFHLVSLVVSFAAISFYFLRFFLVH